MKTRAMPPVCWPFTLSVERSWMSLAASAGFTLRMAKVAWGAYSRARMGRPVNSETLRAKVTRGGHLGRPHIGAHRHVGLPGQRLAARRAQCLRGLLQQGEATEETAAAGGGALSRCMVP